MSQETDPGAMVEPLIGKQVRLTLTDGTVRCGLLLGCGPAGLQIASGIGGRIPISYSQIDAIGEVSSVSQIMASIDYARVEIRTGGRTFVYELGGDEKTPLTCQVSVDADVRETTSEQPEPVWRTWEPTGRKTAQVSLSGVVRASHVEDPPA